jgi:hypothetical protein
MDVLKVDRAFTAELGNSKEGGVFFQATVSMAHALGMSVVAEGVETARQLAILRALDCDEAQGYLVARPVPAPDMLVLMERCFLFDTIEMTASWLALPGEAEPLRLAVVEIFDVQRRGIACLKRKWFNRAARRVPSLLRARPAGSRNCGRRRWAWKQITNNSSA